MNCPCDEDYYEQYLRRLLPADEMHCMMEHADACPACAQRLAAGAKLRESLEALPREIHPERDLWPEIAGKLSRRSAWRQPHGGINYLRAAAVVLVLLGGGLALYWLRSGAPAPLAWQTAEREFAAARTAFLQALDENPELDNATRAVLRENLTVIDGAVAEIIAALEVEPENPDLMRLLLAARHKELDFLKSIVDLPDAG